MSVALSAAPERKLAAPLIAFALLVARRAVPVQRGQRAPGHPLHRPAAPWA
ncbi:Uncharacterised protein [Pseudomonas aeruginosa]|nr:Uncharacterised protein [Pseudomonas aeruginosa]